MKALDEVAVAQVSGGIRVVSSNLADEVKTIEKAIEGAVKGTIKNFTDFISAISN